MPPYTHTALSAPTPLITHGSKNSNISRRLLCQEHELLISGTKTIQAIMHLSGTLANLKRSTLDQKNKKKTKKMSLAVCSDSRNLMGMSQGGGNVLAVNLLVPCQIIALLSLSSMCEKNRKKMLRVCWVDVVFSLPLLMLAGLLCKKISVCRSTSPSVTLGATRKNKHTHTDTHMLRTCISDGNYSFLKRVGSSGSVPFLEAFQKIHHSFSYLF